LSNSGRKKLLTRTGRILPDPIALALHSSHTADLQSLGMLNRLLLVVAIVGLGLCVYLLARPNTVQTVRLEPSTALPSQLESPQSAPKLEVKPAPIVKPRPTQSIEPRQTPTLPVQRPATSTASTSNTSASSPSQPVTSRPSQASTSSANQTSPSNSRQFQDLDTPPAPVRILTPRADGSVWRLQVGAFKSADNADSLRVKLLENGLTAKVVQGTDGISRVLVGDYPTREAAQADNNAVSSRVP
jgi:cell division protein FtsN